jgi:hypothetical protein
MATSLSTSNTPRTRRGPTLVVLAALAAFAVGLAGAPAPRSVDPEEFDGRAPTPRELQPGVEAAFQRESYAPGDSAALVVFSKARKLTMQVLQAGPEHARLHAYNEMRGVPVTGIQRVGNSSGNRRIHLRIGAWRSGLYFARLVSARGLVGFAPFVVRPNRLGSHNVAVVLPTMTWQAYNIRDDDGDGKGDSWYATWGCRTARLGRPFLNRGVPFGFRINDLQFLHWLAWTERDVDYLSDADLDRIRRATTLARAYDLIVFPSHHEYVTPHEFDLVEHYRDLGGNLAFLSANNFFWRTVRHGNVMERTRQWRDLGRPEAAFIGTQYLANDGGRHQGPWVVRHAEAAPWLFRDTGLHNGSRFGWGGIEIDKTAPSSPKGLKVLAEIPNLFGRGFTAQMTYYETPAGARVFAAGAFTLAGMAEAPVVARLLENLWSRLADHSDTAR